MSSRFVCVEAFGVRERATKRLHDYMIYTTTHREAEAHLRQVCFVECRSECKNRRRQSPETKASTPPQTRVASPPTHRSSRRRRSRRGARSPRPSGRRGGSLVLLLLLLFVFLGGGGNVRNEPSLDDPRCIRLVVGKVTDRIQRTDHGADEVGALRLVEVERLLHGRADLRDDQLQLLRRARQGHHDLGLCSCGIWCVEGPMWSLAPDP